MLGHGQNPAAPPVPLRSPPPHQDFAAKDRRSPSRRAGLPVVPRCPPWLDEGTAIPQAQPCGGSSGTALPRPSVLQSKGRAVHPVCFRSRALVRLMALLANRQRELGFRGRLKPHMGLVSLFLSKMTDERVKQRCG